MGSSRSFGKEKTRGSSSLRKGPLGDVILDIYKDVDDGFTAIEVEMDAATADSVSAAEAVAAVEAEATLDLSGVVEISGSGAAARLDVTQEQADQAVVKFTGNDGSMQVTGGTNLDMLRPAINRIRCTDGSGSFEITTGGPGNSRLNIDSTGNVGINKAAPTVTLDVDGAATFTGSTIGLGFSDTGRGFTAQKTADAVTIDVADPGNDGDIALGGSERAGQVTVTLQTTNIDNSNPLRLELTGGALAATDVPMVTVCGTNDAGQLDVSYFIAESGPALHIDIRQFSGAYDIASGTNATLKVNWVLL